MDTLDALNVERMRAVTRAWQGWGSPVRSLTQIYTDAHNINTLSDALSGSRDISAYDGQRLLDMAFVSLSVWRVRQIWHDALAVQYREQPLIYHLDIRPRIQIAQGMTMDGICYPDARYGMKMIIEAARLLIDVGGRATAIQLLNFLYEACVPDTKAVRRAVQAVPSFVLCDHVYLL